MFTTNATRSRLEKIYTSIAIIGAGASSWYTALESSRRGYNNIVLDKDPPGTGSSISNQGWLHSGALYLAGNTPDHTMANYCLQGYHNMLSNYKNVVQQDRKAYFLYAHPDYAEELMKYCQELDIKAKSVRVREIEKHEPLLRGSRLRSAIQVPDCPFNNAQLLQTVADQACQLRTRFCTVDSLDCITAEWDGTHWHLFDQQREIICKFIILGCGSYIPEMLAKLLPGQTSGLLCTKNPVLVLKADTPIARSMLLTVRETKDIHVVPFYGSGISGLTICCGKQQEDAINHKDVSLPPLWKETFTQLLQDYFPGIVDFAHNNGIFAYPYICHKLEQEKDRRENRINRQPLCEIYAPCSGAAGNIAVIYAGKMTTASLLGKMCVDRVEPLLGDLRHNAITEGMQAPRIARQPYYRKAPYIFTVQNGNLHIKEIDPAI